MVAVAALPLLVLACTLNSSLTGRWSGLSTNGGLNFFMMQAEVASVWYFDMGIGPIRAASAMAAACAGYVSAHASRSSDTSRLRLVFAESQAKQVVRRAARHVSAAVVAAGRL
jgi:hypothetical protein